MITITSFPTLKLATVCAEVVGSDVLRSQVGTYCVVMTEEQGKKWEEIKKEMKSK